MSTQLIPHMRCSHHCSPHRWTADIGNSGRQQLHQHHLTHRRLFCIQQFLHHSSWCSTWEKVVACHQWVPPHRTRAPTGATWGEWENWALQLTCLTDRSRSATTVGFKWRQARDSVTHTCKRERQTHTKQHKHNTHNMGRNNHKETLLTSIIWLVLHHKVLTQKKLSFFRKTESTQEEKTKQYQKP